MGFLELEILSEVYKLRKDVKKGFKHMRTAISDFVAAVNAAFATVNTSLDNIVADEANLLQQIKDLGTKITGLDPDEQTALDTVVKSATDLVARTQATADAVPDAPPPPPVA